MGQRPHRLPAEITWRVSEALIEMRKRLNLTREELAEQLRRRPRDLLRWEGADFIYLEVCAELYRFAVKRKDEVSAAAYRQAIEDQLGVRISGPK